MSSSSPRNGRAGAEEASSSSGRSVSCDLADLELTNLAPCMKSTRNECPEDLRQVYEDFQVAAKNQQDYPCEDTRQLFSKAGNRFWHAVLEMAVRNPAKEKRPTSQDQVRTMIASMACSIQEPRTGTLTKTLIMIEEHLEAGPRHKVKSCQSEDGQQMLFSRPSRLRFIIFGSWIRHAKADHDLASVLANSHIWLTLVKLQWARVSLPGDHGTLKYFFGKFEAIIQIIARAILTEKVLLPPLRVVRDGQFALLNLCEALGFEAQKVREVRDRLSKSLEELKDFDDKLSLLGTFQRHFCEDLQTPTLDTFLEQTHNKKDLMTIREAALHFTPGIGLPQLELQWFYKLRNSFVFKDIWATSLSAVQAALGSTIAEEHIESHIYPRARELWEALGKSLEGHTAQVKHVPWMIDQDWDQVLVELERMVSTEVLSATAVPAATTMAEACRNAKRWSSFAPALLNIKELLSTLFEESTVVDDVEVAMLKIQKDFANLEDMPLLDVVEATKPYLRFFSDLCEQKLDYIIQLAEGLPCLSWIADLTSTEEFDRLIHLATPETKDPTLLRGIAFLQQTRTFLASILYVKKHSYSGIKSFLEAWAEVSIDANIFEALPALQIVFSEVKGLIETLLHKPVINSCEVLKDIFENGRLIVKCSSAQADALVCESNDLNGPTLTEEELQELVQSLLMVDFDALFFEFDGAQVALGSSPQAMRSMLDSLCEKLQVLRQCCDCVQKLFALGYFEYSDSMRVLKVAANESTGILEASCEQLQAKLELWSGEVAAARGDYYFLNFYTMREIYDLASCLAAGNLQESQVDTVWNLLRVVNPSLDRDLVLDEVRRFPANLSPGKSLGAIGQLLHKISHKNSIVERPLSISHEDGPPGPIAEAPIWVAAVAEPALSSLLALYARRGHFPEAEELLLCSENTTLEELDIFFRRFLMAGRHRRGKRLFCLVNFECLPYAERQGAIGLLEEYEHRQGFGNAASLVFLSPDARVRATANLPARWPRLPVAALTPELLKRVLSVEQLGVCVEVVTGELDGVGKTHHIYRKVEEIQSEQGKRPVLHHVAIHETTLTSELLQALSEDPTDPSRPTCIHLELAHVVPTHTDSRLFELLVLGVLRDRERRRVYHRRPEDCFFIEIPSTPGDALMRHLPFCTSLPGTRLAMAADRLEAQRASLTWREDGPYRSQFVVFNDNENLIATGKELAAIRDGAFDPHSQAFNRRWNFRRVPPAPLDFVYEELCRLCTSEGSPPSFAQFMAFANYFGSMVIQGERWNMFQVNLLVHFDQGLKQFKHSFLNILAETAKTFALRQVPKDRSPLGQVAVDADDGAREVEGILNRLGQMALWDECPHPVTFFKLNSNRLIIGANIMCLQKDFVGRYMSESLMKSLNTNDSKLYQNWSEVGTDEAVRLLQQIEGVDRYGAPAPVRSDYVVTIDNLLKLLTIHQRLRCGLPTVIMGDTGCGKTALVNFLCEIVGFHLVTLNVHGGITETSIVEFVNRSIDEMPQDAAGLVLFLDEINAANCLALFKSIIVDRRCGNRHLPDNVRVVACCNPYRKRKGKELEDVALTYQHQGSTFGEGEVKMKDLVYRVHPLPESLMDIIYNFGSLNTETERLYIAAMLSKELPAADDHVLYQPFINAFVELLLTSHSYVREVNDGEPSVVSMRDIARALKVFKWFMIYNPKTLQNAESSQSGSCDPLPIAVSPETLDGLQEALVLMLGFCYHARLEDASRREYRRRLCECWTRMPIKDLFESALTWSSCEEALHQSLLDAQLAFVSQMNLGVGISLNEALRENLFMLLVSIMNHIPILLVGRPGCSKSLAMTILQSNLRGSVSSVDIFKSMPALNVVTYQCSPLSKPEDITKTFQHARDLNVNNAKTINCVLLDEVGLAEESPELPLKVLHRELEHLQGITFVGISNWALDSAKMNRCITLYRPAPTGEHLLLTAQGMVTSVRARASLASLVEAFQQLCKTQECPDFWGMRDFYSTVRMINDGLKDDDSMDDEDCPGISPQLLMQTAQRNFGGRPQELETCVSIFFERLGLKAAAATRYSSAELIRQNLRSADARHLMLLTKNNAALRLLFRSSLVEHGKVQIMFGSTFPKDQNDMFIAARLQRVKTYMQQPICLILVHCDALYESLYDLLNQHYMEHCGQRYVRIAHGSKAMKQCPIHDKFRIVVISEAEDAYMRLPAPLLNRFEKQTFSREDVMEEEDRTLLHRLNIFYQDLQGMVHRKGRRAPRQQQAKARHLLPVAAGWHDSQLASLACMLRKEQADSSMDEQLASGKRHIMKVMTLESVCLLAAQSTAEERLNTLGLDVSKEYFDTMNFSDLGSFAQELVKSEKDWVDKWGSQVGVLTYSSVSAGIGQKVAQTVAEGLSVEKEEVQQTEIFLHDLSTITDIEANVTKFYQTATGGECQTDRKKNFLIIHADPAEIPIRMIEYCRFHCEKARAEALEIAGDAAGCVFVILVVYLSSQTEGSFSFDFDSNWRFAYLDAVHRPQDCRGFFPAEKVNSTFLEVVEEIGLPGLLQDCCRTSVSRLQLQGPATRGGLGRQSLQEDWQQRIGTVLQLLEDRELHEMVLSWMRRALDASRFGSKAAKDGNSWLEEMVLSSTDFAVAGGFRYMMYHKITGVVGTVFAVLLARLDRNAGWGAILDSSFRNISLQVLRVWASSDTFQQAVHLALSNGCQVGEKSESASTSASLNGAKDAAATTIDVANDCKTAGEAFQSQFPVSWFVSKDLDKARAIVQQAPKERQSEALQEVYRLTKLADLSGIEASHLERYLADFCAMYVERPRSLPKQKQEHLLKAILERSNEGELKSILEIHRHFWSQEHEVTFCCNLVAAAPAAIECVLKCIAKTDMESMRSRVLLEVQQFLLQHMGEMGQARLTPPERQQAIHDSLTSIRLVLQMSKDCCGIKANSNNTDNNDNNNDDHRSKASSSSLIEIDTELAMQTGPKLKVLELFLEHVPIPEESSGMQPVQKFARDLHNLKSPRSLATMSTIVKASTNCSESRGHIQPFVESWFLEVCLQDLMCVDSLEDGLLDVICNLVAGFPLSLPGTSTEEDYMLQPSESFSLALLRKLLSVSKGTAREEVQKKLRRALKETFELEQHRDTNFAVRHCILAEEAAAKDLGSEPSKWPKITLSDISDAALKDDPEGALSKFGQAKWMLKQYAKSLCDYGAEDARTSAFEAAVKGLLITEDQTGRELCRSARLFLLECVGRSKGMSFVATTLNGKERAEDGWIEDWKKSDFAEFSRLADVRTLKWNPTFENSLVEEAQDVLKLSMHLGDPDGLTSFAARIRGASSPDDARVMLGAFLLALCQECGLSSARDSNPGTRLVVYNWLGTDTTLPVTPRERNLLRIFAGDTSVFAALPVEMQAFYDGFKLDPSKSAQDAIRFRATAHIVAAMLSASDSSLFSVFRQVMLEPESVVAEAHYLPCMAEGIRETTTKALIEAGENIWRHRSHWYKCSCEHQFFIGECGKAMEESKCNNCGKLIGGQNHDLNEHTTLVEDGDTDLSIPGGYTLSFAANETEALGLRKCSKADVHTVRLLLHTAMYGALGAATSEDPGNALRLFANLANRDFSRLHQDGTSEAEFVYQHLCQDWKLLAECLGSNEEDVAAALHETLIEMQTAQGQSPPETKVASAASSSSLSSASTEAGPHRPWVNMSSGARDKWEETMCGSYLTNMHRRLANNRLEYRQRWSTDGAESLQVTCLASYKPSQRCEALPNLWHFRKNLTFEAQTLRTSLPHPAEELYPIQYFILQPQVLAILPALRCLAGMFRWHSLLTARLGHKLTREEAAKKTVQSLLEGISLSEQATWHQAWRDLKTAWGIAWPFIERHNCLEIPAHFRSIRLSEDTPLLYTIMDSDNEGICAMALTEWLLQRHNDLVQLATGHGGRCEVSSDLMADHDQIKFKEDDLWEFVKTRCVSYTARGDVKVEHGLLEKHLRQVLTRPTIRFEGKPFEWLGYGSSAGSVFDNLAMIIPQEPLPQRTKDRLRNELASPEKAFKVQRKVLMAMSFLLKSTNLEGNVAGAQLLSNYLSSVLQDPEELPSATANAEVHLKHLGSFANLIKSLLTQDPTDAIPNKYRASLPQDLHQQLVRVLHQLPAAQLAAAMVSSPLEALRIECIGEDVLLWETLRASIDFEEEQRVSEILGKGLRCELKMKHWVEVYRILDEEDHQEVPQPSSVSPALSPDETAATSSWSKSTPSSPASDSARASVSSLEDSSPSTTGRDGVGVTQRPLDRWSHSGFHCLENVDFLVVVVFFCVVVVVFLIGSLY